jgi:hypothetical protein
VIGSRGGDAVKFRKWYGSGRGRSYTANPYAWRTQGGAVYANLRKEDGRREARAFAPTLAIVANHEGDGRRCAHSVAATDATQETSATLLLHSLRGIGPKVQRLCAAIIDGASLDEAARESNLGVDDLEKLLPQLRRFLA